MPPGRLSRSRYILLSGLRGRYDESMEILAEATQLGSLLQRKEVQNV